MCGWILKSCPGNSWQGPCILAVWRTGKERTSSWKIPYTLAVNTIACHGTSNNWWFERCKHMSYWHWYRRGEDLFMCMDIQLVEALCGFQKPISTLDNRTIVITSHPGMIFGWACLSVLVLSWSAVSWYRHWENWYFTWSVTYLSWELSWNCIGYWVFLEASKKVMGLPHINSVS